MKIVVAPNAFKGSLSAVEAAHAIGRGVKRAHPDAEIICHAMSDGGDSLLEVLVEHYHASTIVSVVNDPLGKKIKAEWGLLPEKKLAIIELAKASGLTLLNENELDPVNSSTFGTGELIKQALDYGCTRVLLGLGGSATVDGGLGICAALGLGLKDSSGAELAPCGANLSKITNLDLGQLDTRLGDCRIELITDVTNPLLGPQGAAAIFGPQKGADPEQVELLETGLTHWASMLESQTGVAVQNMTGAGAAGGVAGTLHALFGASILAGAEAVAELTGLENALEGATLVLTGEGKIDHQTISGKAPGTVATLARKHGVRCIGIGGKVGLGIGDLFDTTFQLCDDATPLQDCIDNAATLLENISEKAVTGFTKP